MYEKKIEKALKNVIILDNKNIIESGWVKKIDLLNNEIKIYLSLSNPAMHLKNKLIKDITHSIKNQNILDTIRIIIEIKSDPKIKPIKNIIAVASGKGGVGKSTIATNIAVSLVKMGFHVGLLDADIYGPSIPLMFNLEKESVKLQHKNGILDPITSYGVKILSTGFF